MVNTSLAQNVVLNFAENHALKAVFDAGVRPYRRANLETLQLRAEAVRASVVLPGGFVSHPKIGSLLILLLSMMAE